MWDLNPRPQKTHGPVDDAICQGISGVLVRLTTCKRLTDSFPYPNYALQQVVKDAT